MELTVETSLGQLVAVPGGEPERYPEILLKLRRPDGKELILAAVTDISQDEPDTLRIGAYKDPYADEMDIRVCLAGKDLQNPKAQFHEP